MALIDDFVEELLFQCIYAVGLGAQMPVQRSAIVALLNKTRPGFVNAVGKAPDSTKLTDLEAEWQKAAYFILACSVRIGQVAATNANTASPAHFSITETDLMDAYKSVRAPFSAAAPGDYCPP